MNAHVSSPAGLAVADFDGDGQQEMVIAAIDNVYNYDDPFDDPYDDYFRFRVGRNCLPGGTCTFGPIQQSPAPTNGTDKHTWPRRGGVAAGDLDGNGTTDIILVGIDSEARFGARWVIAVGFDCDVNGACGTWITTNVLIVDHLAHGGGVAVGDFDGNGSTDIALAATDDNALTWRYSLGGCTKAGCNFFPSVAVPVNENSVKFSRARAADGGITATNIRRYGRGISNTPGDQILLTAHIYHEGTGPDGGAEWGDYFATNALHMCDMTTGVCRAGVTRVQDTGIRDLSGSGAAFLMLPQSEPGIILAGVDHRESLTDNWVLGSTRFAFSSPGSAGWSERWHFGPYDIEKTDLRIGSDNDVLGRATSIGVPHNWQYSIDRASIACPVEIGSPCTNDIDWYRFVLAAPRTVTISMSHTTTVPDLGDLDLGLYDGGGTLIAASSYGVSGGGPVTESITRALAPGTYFVKVFGFDYGAGNGAGTGAYRAYTLQVN